MKVLVLIDEDRVPQSVLALSSLVIREDGRILKDRSGDFDQLNADRISVAIRTQVKA